MRVMIMVVRAPFPRELKWVFAEYGWKPGKQKYCIHGIDMRSACKWCSELTVSEAGFEKEEEL